MRASLLAFVAAWPIAIAAASCAVEGFTVGKGAGGSAASTTATTTASTGTAGGGGAGGEVVDAGDCGHATYPNPPSGTTSDGNEDFIVALRSIDWGEDAEVPPGLDLDGKCSCCCEGEASSCLEPKTICDFPQGIDNAAAGLFKFIGGALENFSSAFFSSSSELGAWSIVFRVRGYNGEVDDDQVELDWYMSSGTRDAAGVRIPAKWDGTDTWGIMPDSLEAPDGGVPNNALGVDGNAPKFVDPNAYVSNGTLVASMPSTDIRLAGSINTILLRLTGAYLVARIETEPGGGAHVLRDGLIVGKWKLADLFLALSSYRDADGSAFCTDNSLYKIGKPTLCKNADTFSGSTTPTTPCDAVSIGIAFQSHPAAFGVVVAPPAELPGCPPETDPANDTCTTP